MKHGNIHKLYSDLVSRGEDRGNWHRPGSSTSILAREFHEVRGSPVILGWGLSNLEV